MSDNLNPDKAFIFRVTHVDNVPWILEHGLHCRNSEHIDPNFVEIGDPDLINKRRNRVVPIPPGGTLSDDVPFYFTPYSPMMLKIKTGHGGIRKRQNEEIVIFVSSLYKLENEGIPFVFTDRHAKLETAEHFNRLTDLNRIDWSILQKRDFKRDLDDPGKVERYQAEALIYRHVPVGALLGLVCYNKTLERSLTGLTHDRGVSLRVVATPEWYFK